MTTIYLAASARSLLEAAQTDIDQHISGIDGRCIHCQMMEPCPSRTSAEAIFARYGRLPVRTPGRTLHAAKTRGGFTWLDRSAPI